MEEFGLRSKEGKKEERTKRDVEKGEGGKKLPIKR